MGTYQLPSSRRLTYSCWILYRVSSHVPEEDEDEDEEHEYTSVQDTMQVSLVYTEKEADEIRKVIQEEEKRCKRMEDRAKHIMRVVCSTIASPG